MEDQSVDANAMQQAANDSKTKTESANDSSAHGTSSKKKLKAAQKSILQKAIEKTDKLNK